ncbi:protein-disulfide reductase DsbD family protein [Pontiella sp.]|uniref:protein-disulfide reductase DsbD family protein n=1 Tax=Pontiella sp. TaxID=2837462 RepID=UPI00356517A7
MNMFNWSFRSWFGLAVGLLLPVWAYGQFGAPYSVTVQEIDPGAKEQVSLEIVFDIPADIHVFASEDQFFAFSVKNSTGLGKPVLEMPELKDYTDQLGETSPVLTGHMVIRATLPYTGAPGSRWALEGFVGSQGCDDNTCFAPRSDAFSLSGVVPQDAVVTAAKGAVAPVAPVEPPAESAPRKGVSADVNNLGFDYEINGGASDVGGEAGIGVIIKYMIFAFLGGLILNFMPCVLPVLSIKAMSIVGSAHQDRKEIFKGAMSYTAGVLVSFLTLAALVIIAKAGGQSAGWGDHMQNPVFVIVLFILIWVFSLSLFDVFIIQLPGMGVATKASSHAGHKGSFFSGVFAVLLSTPCTAPMLGSAVGFMFAQPAYLVVLSFLLIGLGLAFPFILLGLSPRAMKYIPKPGEWMNTFKEVMAFLLIGTAVFLLSILYSLLGESFLRFCVFILPLSFSCWLYGKYAGPGNPVRRQWVFSAIALAVAVGSGVYLIDVPERMSPEVRDQQIGGWAKLSDELVAKAKGEGRPLLVDYNSVWSEDHGSFQLDDTLKKFVDQHDVILARDESTWKPLNAETLRSALVDDERMVFIDFGAEWCATCKVNERTVLFTDAMQAEFKKRDVLLLKGDFTHRDPEINEWLERFGRAGVPLYVLFKPGETIQAVTLPELINAGMVIDALDG